MAIRLIKVFNLFLTCLLPTSLKIAMNALHRLNKFNEIGHKAACNRCWKLLSGYLTRESVEIILQFQTLGVVSDSKMNLVGALRRSFFEFPNSFQKRRGKTKKNLRKNRNFYAKPVFDQIDFFIWFVDKKILDDQKCLIFRKIHLCNIPIIGYNTFMLEGGYRIPHDVDGPAPIVKYVSGMPLFPGPGTD
ncbi:Uncharacterized protein FWK35_00017556, partial [Aphis craccivora]